ncbi:putative acyl carrier protein [Teladorsagia circumcincta]|uniref:Acyl carrier protein n=1 Tax=Teladorsagia circumcincta TaxID=45464 RepID=A0A2G9UJ06_TELCI|nr:putative acyl carrier protein [Teladorsagia circumcincta]
MFGRSAIRVASCIAAGRRCLTSFASVPTSSLSRLATPSQCALNQKRFSQVEVFGPFDPPKQLTFKEVESRVLKAIRAWDRFPADKEALLKIEADFMKDLGFDSLDQVEIMMAIEDEFGFEIPLEDSEKLKTPRDVFKYICEREDVFE